MGKDWFSQYLETGGRTLEAFGQAIVGLVLFIMVAPFVLLVAIAIFPFWLIGKASSWRN